MLSIAGITLAHSNNHICNNATNKLTQCAEFVLARLGVNKIAHCGQTKTCNADLLLAVHLKEITKSIIIVKLVV